ncbi:MAG: 16S rRNA (adenine(1518)-N(6)/adenine(1519)-N(6))-dimethyltransferase RsmA [Minisyncoccia bacterium]
MHTNRHQEHTVDKLAARSSGLAAKKSLGQHFLNDKKYLRAIADAALFPKDRPLETIVEIGPGKGSLTAELLARGARVIALEKDRRLILFLQEKFSKEITEGKLHLVETDALEFEPSGSRLAARGYSLIGNIPYYVTGALLSKFLTEKIQPSRIVFLVQKEVAERIARSKKESRLSLSVKCYGEPRYIQKVPKGVFSPPPSVDSAILLIDHISRKHFSDAAHEKRFFELVRAGFAHKRKLLVRNMEPVFAKDSPLQITAALKEASIPEKARAEDVALEKWLRLVNALGIS